MMVDENPALIGDSDILQYHPIFGTDFIDKRISQLDYNNDFVCWMEYGIPI